jgi:polysaccharide biosynthesis PFTS motif protein
MKNSANPDLVRFLNEQMSLTKIRLKNSVFSHFMLGQTNETIEIAYRQYILLYLTGTKLNAILLKFLSTNESIVIPLPDEWLQTLTDNNIKVSKFLSKIFFLFFALKQYIIGVLQFFSYLIKNLLYQFKKKEISRESFSYLMYLHTDCLPPRDGSSNYNIIEWYLKWDGKAEGITQIQHGVKVSDYYHSETLISNSSYIPKIENAYKLLLFALWGISSIFIALFNLLIGRLQYCIMFREAIENKIISLTRNSHLAREYLFNNENMFYRPLWTYTAESKGSKITYYNWAASFGDFLGPHGYPPAEIGERIQNWPNILQWAMPYGKYLQSILVSTSSEVKIVDPIYYCDFGSESYKSDKPLISIFDVTPQRTYFMDVLVPSVEYRTYIVGKKFLEDIYEIATQNGFNLLWKRKRNYSARHHKAYIKFAEEFSKRPGVISANPRSSAFHVVQQSKAVISVPFTSTALIAESFNIPSVYYDPSKILFNEDRAAQGIPLVSGKEELKNWFQSFKTKVL